MGRSQAVQTAQVGAAPFFAGKNKIINGDFRINQRGFSSSTTATSNVYGLDRWFMYYSNGTCTYSVQTFTPGAAPVAGYEAINFARIQTTGQTLTSAETALLQRIEDVRTFAGQTVTLSFWAKAASGTPKVAVNYGQEFGSGGSSNVQTVAGDVTLSTSWARYSITFNVPSISGKTVGTGSTFCQLLFWVSAGSDFNARTNSLGIQTNTFDFWGVQLEAGSVATPFQTATGTLQGELAACQRYYWRTDSGVAFANFAMAMCASTTAAYATIDLPATMRIAPTTIDVPSTITRLKLTDIGSNNFTISAIVSEYSTKDTLSLKVTSSGLTLQNIVVLTDAGGNNSFIGASAEL